MSNRGIRPNHPGTLEVRRVAYGCIRKAHRALRSGALSDRAVHEARKAIRQSRAAVRLLRGALGSTRYHRENQRLRDAGRALNAVRDAKVLVRTLQSLRERDPQLNEHRSVIELAHRLRSTQQATQRQLRRPSLPMSAACRTLQQTAFSAGQWPVGHAGWARLGPAFRRIYAAGRQAARASRTAADDHALHEWRKQVKYLWHALQMFEPLRPRKLRKRIKLARCLAEELGDNHDLAVLRASALGQGDGAAQQLQPLFNAIQQRSERLRKNALTLGERVYAETPAEMNRRLERYWHRWHDRRSH
jgi:CHAD domain-containing protein